MTASARQLAKHLHKEFHRGKFTMERGQGYGRVWRHLRFDISSVLDPNDAFPQKKLFDVAGKLYPDEPESALRAAWLMHSNSQLKLGMTCLAAIPFGWFYTESQRQTHFDQLCFAQFIARLSPYLAIPTKKAPGGLRDAFANLAARIKG